jgi:hypothetical protein
VLILDVSRQSAVPGLLLEPFSCWTTLITQIPRVKTGVDHGVTEYAYRTPYRLDAVEMAATMLFSGGVAVNPFKAEVTIFHSGRTHAVQRLSRHYGRYILSAAAGVNMVGSCPLRLRQVRSIYPAGPIDKLFSRTIHDFEVPCGEPEQILHNL